MIFITEESGHYDLWIVSEYNDICFHAERLRDHVMKWFSRVSPLNTIPLLPADRSLLESLLGTQPMSTIDKMVSLIAQTAKNQNYKSALWRQNALKVVVN